MTSVFDLFKIGIGPSSSHTVGPMVAANRFRRSLPIDALRIQVELLGSLAWTGRGHLTDVAICLGLLGEEPATVVPERIPVLREHLERTRAFLVDGGRHPIAFDPQNDILFNFEDVLPRHPNAMRFRAFGPDGALVLERIQYSIGGGFVVDHDEPVIDGREAATLPFGTARELLELCEAHGSTIAAIQLVNEVALRNVPDIEQGLDSLVRAMFDCIDRGLRHDGLLPGGLGVRRRAKSLFENLSARDGANDRHPHEIMDWISLFALAVNEENAAGGRVVTAPTNGAAGIVPAVLRYCRDFCPGWDFEKGRSFLLTAAAIGGLIKHRASICGAEVGCQGEVGSAAAMAASGLAAALGGSVRQVQNAAEIAMEHHLGMTCDPVAGLVQVPCIERNAMGANKAIVAASLAMRGDGHHRVSLDEVIETMRQTGADMGTRYKETSRGGLAINVAAC